MKFQLLRSEKIYQGRVFDVRLDELLLPNGKRVSLDIVEHPGAVTMVPVDDQGAIWFVRQYRHSTGEVLLELPAGSLEEGEPPDECAGREMREETGMSAGELQKIGEFFLAPGYSTEFLHVYLAMDLRPAPLQPDEDEFLSVERLPIAQVYAMIEAGKFRDGKTLAALLLARPHLEKRLD